MYAGQSRVSVRDVQISLRKCGLIPDRCRAEGQECGLLGAAMSYIGPFAHCKEVNKQ